VRNEIHFDCFLSALIYALKELKMENIIIPIMILSYNVHYNSLWKSLNENIIFPYKEIDIKNGLFNFGINCCSDDNVLKKNKMYLHSPDKITTIEIDGYICPWHPAYYSYHVKHHMILVNFNSVDTIEVLDPFISNEPKFLSYYDIEHIPAKYIIYSKSRRVQIDIEKFVSMHFSQIGKDMINNIKLFSYDFPAIYSKLIDGVDDFNSVQYFRDLNSIINSKNILVTILQEIGKTQDIIDAAIKLKNKWNILFNRLVHSVITKQKQNDLLLLLTDIIERESILISLL
jgi:hypothetical protein